MTTPIPTEEESVTNEAKKCDSSTCDGVNHWLGDQAFACPHVEPRAAEPVKPAPPQEPKPSDILSSMNAQAMITGPVKYETAPPQDAEPVGVDAIVYAYEDSQAEIGTLARAYLALRSRLAASESSLAQQKAMAQEYETLLSRAEAKLAAVKQEGAKVEQECEFLSSRLHAEKSRADKAESALAEANSHNAFVYRERELAQAKLAVAEKRGVPKKCIWRVVLRQWESCEGTETDKGRFCLRCGGEIVER